jgi:hypothetical protein
MKKKKVVLLGDSERDETAIAAAVCRFFIQGYSFSEIAKLIHANYGIPMNREVPYQYIRHAIKKGWLSFDAPTDNELINVLRKKFPSFDLIDVVPTRDFDGVAERAAAQLIEIIRQLAKPPSNKRTVHIGWSGGNSVRKIAVALAKLLKVPRAHFAEEIVFHSLVSGFELENPWTDPNAFFIYFRDQDIQVETRFVAIHAPSIVKPSQRKELLKLPDIEIAYGKRDEIDILVSSAGELNDPHNMLSRYYGKAAQPTIKILRDAKCVGDIFWLPLAERGPIPLDDRHRFRSMTLLEISELPEMISKGKKVLIAIGPCGQCPLAKPSILKAILLQDRPMATHIVVDSMSAKGAITEISKI